MCDEIDVVVKSKIGDVVIAKNKNEFMDALNIEVGQEWTVTNKSEYFVEITNDKESFWLGDINFVDIFESE